MALVAVRYKGLSDIREITKKQWLAEDVAVSKDTVWDRSNRFTVYVDATDRMMEVFKQEEHFQVSEVTDDNTERVVIEASNPAREPDVIVDGRTGQREDVKHETPLAGSAGAGTSKAGSTGRGSSTKGDG